MYSVLEPCCSVGGSISGANDNANASDRMSQLQTILHFMSCTLLCSKHRQSAAFV